MLHVPTVSLSDAQATLPALLDLVADGEEITITHHGVPVAVVIRPDALRVRRAASGFDEADALRSTLERARHMAIDEAPILDAAVADNYVAELHADRKSR
jgi:antitoxin (DNA-binding transcriptional repressor) of toxin-antitoxin stability system